MDEVNILPEGTRDLILDECITKRDIEKEIDSVFQKWGYKEVITPTIEFFNNFNTNFQNLKEEQMYKFFDSKGRILVLRPDMTIPIARVIKTKFKDNIMPLRLRYKSNIFRVHTSFDGKENEFTDCGVEFVGGKKYTSDLEIIIMALNVLKKLKINKYKLEIGNIGFVKELLNSLKVSEDDRKVIAQYIEEKNLKSLENYIAKLEIDEKYKFALNKIPWMFGSKEILDESEKLPLNSKAIDEIKYLKKLYGDIKELGYAENITFDLGMAPRFDYYTGIIFRTYIEGVGNTVVRGGRYDKLINIKGEDIPSIGFSIDVNALIKKEMEIRKSDTEEIIEVSYPEKYFLKAIRESEDLREKGHVVKLTADEGLTAVKISKIGGKN